MQLDDMGNPRVLLLYPFTIGGIFRTLDDVIGCLRHPLRKASCHIRRKRIAIRRVNAVDHDLIHFDRCAALVTGTKYFDRLTMLGQRLSCLTDVGGDAA